MAVTIDTFAVGVASILQSSVAHSRLAGSIVVLAQPYRGSFLPEERAAARAARVTALAVVTPGTRSIRPGARRGDTTQ
jgi:hypothetical protein